MRILIADDDAVCRAMLEDTIRSCGHDPISVADGGEAWRVLQMESAPRLAILDWVMPRMEGVEICRKMRGRLRNFYTYIILLTARDARNDTIAGLDAGADDFLTKPVDLAELRARLRVGLRILDLQDVLLAGQETLRLQATHDPLTHVLNRAGILSCLEREMSRAERVGARVGVLKVDIDEFNEINETHGHLTGDAVLREISRRMRSLLRPYDGVGRLDGDAFLLVMPGCDGASATCVAERVRAACAGAAVETSSGPVFVTVSVGGTVSCDFEDSSIEPMLKAADETLVRAKREGRNRVLVQRRGRHSGVESPALIGSGTFDASAPNDRDHS